MKLPIASLYSIYLAISAAVATDSAHHGIITASASGGSAACAKLAQLHPELTAFPDSVNYTTQNTRFWSAANYLSPACIFSATDAKTIQSALRIFVHEHAEFAVRGGGHMPIPGAASTASGVLVSLSSMTELTLSKDKATIAVGSGNRWGDVYNYLEPHGLAVVGGRVFPIGVSGLLLGGGIGLLGAQHGFASDNVVEYEVVLANATIVTANKKENPDLWWSLKAGGNSFGIVTKFVLETYPSKAVWAGTIHSPATAKDAWIDALAAFGTQLDAKAAIIPSYVLVPSQQVEIYISAMFYDGDNAAPKPLKNFLALPQLGDSGWGKKTFAGYVRETIQWSPDGSRQVFYTMSSTVSREAVQIPHDIFADAVKALGTKVIGMVATLSFQPISKSFVEQGYLRGGNPQNISVKKAPYFFMIINIGYASVSDDVVVRSFVHETAARINRALEDKTLKAEYLYLNDADEGQKIFESYGEGSLERLRDVRRSVDPQGVFMGLEKGGWKVGC